MYRKEDFEITLPSIDYLENSKLIKKVGIQCHDLSDDLTDYWTSDEDEISALNVNVYGQVISKSIDSNSGVRPLIKSRNLPEIIESSNFYYKQEVPIIEFGSWYSSWTVQLRNPINLSFTGRCYPIGETKMGLEFESDNKRYVLFNDKFRPVVPIKWYYDQENNLLLSVNSLFYSLRKVKLYNGDFISFSLFDILENQVLPLILDSGNMNVDDASGDIQNLVIRKELDDKINKVLKK